MAYNPYFPANYGMQYPYAAQMVQNPAQQSGGLIWVQGIEAAKSHPVGAGQSVLLMDSETNSFFIKSADASGMPLPLRVFDYTERSTAVKATESVSVPSIDTSGFITRDEFESRIAQLYAEYGAKKKPTMKKESEIHAE